MAQKPGGPPLAGERLSGMITEADSGICFSCQNAQMQQLLILSLKRLDPDFLILQFIAVTVSASAR